MTTPDQDYLDFLYELLGDKAVAAEWESIWDEATIMSAARAAIDEGAASPEELSEVADLIRRDSSPKRRFRGSLIDYLRELALVILSDYRAQLEPVPVGLLPTRELNAFAARTPSGGAVIILDSGVIEQLYMLVRYYFAFYTWHSSEPYCRDHPQSVFADAIYHLAQYGVTGSMFHFIRFATLRCPSIPDFDERASNISAMIELFILMHEYGHVVLHHFSTPRSKRHLKFQGLELEAINVSQQQEFQADEFALTKLVEHLRAAGGKDTDYALAAGLLLKFLSLCDAISPPPDPMEELTHPSPAARWLRIKELAKVDEYPLSLAANLDPAFEAIYRGLDINRPS